MNYRNEQFFNSGVFSDGRDDATEKSNPPFIYPDRVVRVLKEFEAPADGVTTRYLKSTAVTLDRGFMRNLNTNLGGGDALPKRRLNFQFNPQDIQQVVSQREGMYLSILQDPAQFLQPTAGSTSFAFDLLFDRTMEVANNTGQKADLLNPGSEDAYDIGVLADLNQLYTIIGQGFSKDLLDYQTTKMKTDAQYDYQQNIDDFKDADGNALDTAQGFGAIDTFASSINLGNAAFLIPQPVRIVFSSLFMVDGFVTSTDIQFTKFNTNMVPIQCKVILQVNAVYIGFARDKTFLTNQLDQAQALRTIEVQAAKDEHKSNTSVYHQYLKNMNIGFSADARIIGCYSKVQQFYEAQQFSGFATRGWSGRLTGVESNRITSQFCVSLYSTSVGSDTYDDNPILQFYKDGKDIKIDQTVFIDVYGPYDTESAAIADKSNSTKSKPKVGQYSAKKTSTTAEDWKKSIVWVAPNENLNTANTSNDAITPSNANSKYNLGIASGASDLLDIKDALKDKYFVVYISVKVNIVETVGDITTPTLKELNRTVVYKGSDTGRSEKFPIQWLNSSGGGPDKVFIS